MKSGVCIADCRFDSCRFHAVVAQLVECDLPKVDVAGSSPVYCSGPLGSMRPSSSGKTAVSKTVNRRSIRRGRAGML